MRSTHRHAAAFLPLSAILLLFAVTPASVSATHVQLVRTFDGNVEGLAIDKTGIYVSEIVFGGTGRVWRLSLNGRKAEVVAPAVPQGLFGPLGLATGPAGSLVLANATFDDRQGIYLVSPDGLLGLVASIPLGPTFGFPNGATFDPDGRLYVTSSLEGAVIRVTRAGTVETWIQDDVLVGHVAPPALPVGANGIVYDSTTRSLVVTNYSDGLLVRIPVLADGGAGVPEVIADGLPGADGVAVNRKGRLFVVQQTQNMVVAVTPGGGPVEILATEDDGLNWPASAAFGPSEQWLYVTNFALPPGAPPGRGSVVRVRVHGSR